MVVGHSSMYIYDSGRSVFLAMDAMGHGVGLMMKLGREVQMYEPVAKVLGNEILSYAVLIIFIIMSVSE